MCRMVFPQETEQVQGLWNPIQNRQSGASSPSNTFLALGSLAVRTLFPHIPPSDNAHYVASTSKSGLRKGKGNSDWQFCLFQVGHEKV